MQPIPAEPTPPNWSERCQVCGAGIVSRSASAITDAKIRQGWGAQRCPQHRGHA